jgi:hypothetical protein
MGQASTACPILLKAGVADFEYLYQAYPKSKRFMPCKK